MATPATVDVAEQARLETGGPSDEDEQQTPGGIAVGLIEKLAASRK
jgi:hypothetical protein